MGWKGAGVRTGVDVLLLTLPFLSDPNAGSGQLVPGRDDWQLHRHLPAGRYPRPLEGEHQLPESPTSSRTNRNLKEAGALLLFCSKEHLEPLLALKLLLLGGRVFPGVEIGAEGEGVTA